MKHTVQIFLYLLIPFITFGQVAPDKYWVQFADKTGTPYSIDEPEAFLTQRAIDRRIKQGIAINDADLPVNPNYVAGVQDAGATILNTSKWLNGVSIETTNSSVLEAIAQLPYVLTYRKLVDNVIENEIKQKDFFANETIHSEQLSPVLGEKSSSFFNYGNAYTQINQINGIPLHDQGFRGQGMVIAILDGGFNNAETHPAFDSLWANNQILGTKDFVHPGGSVFNESSHGTSVLSTMGANVPGQMIGTAPKASYWLLRSEYVVTENILEEYNWVSAAEFADSVGADVINSSLGYIDFDMPQWDHSYADMDGETNIATIGADIASDKGILVVNSAGNSGSSSSFPYIGAPADGFDVFTIGAVDGSGNRASFSSIGPTYDGRLKPDVMAMGQNTAIATGSSNFSTGNGTSFSSPVMAGMSACLWQANPTFTNLQIKAALMQSGNYAVNPDAYYGHGIPDFVVAASVLTTIQQDEMLDHQAFIRLSPNPFSNNLQLKMIQDYQSFSASVYDVTGRIVFRLEVQDASLKILEQQLEQLKSGFYLLNLVNGSQQQSLKIIKQ